MAKFLNTLRDKNIQESKKKNSRSKKSKEIALPNGEKIRIVVVGGVEEVGRNMTMVEYGNDIVIIDMGLQFPEEDMPGVDYIIPNIDCLKGKEKNIRGVFITHGHYDHIGGVSHLIPELGNPPIFTGGLTAGLIKKKHSQFKNVKPLKINVIDETHVTKAGKLEVRFVRVNHSIPDSFAVSIKTPYGVIFHTGDFKFDYHPVDDKPADLQKYALIGEQGVLCLLSDSTSSESPGYQISESVVGEELYKAFSTAKGRIIVGTFASQLSRIQQLIWLAEDMGKKVLLEGRSINNNVEIAHELGYLKYKKGTLITDKDLPKIPDHKLVVIGTGAQGEKNAILMRVATKSHRYLDIKRGDTVIFSSSVIPGNERSIQTLKDLLFRCGARVIHYKMMDIHAGGHAKIEEQKLLIRLLKPQFFIPIEAPHYLLQLHAKTAQSVGVPAENIAVPDNGQVVEIYETKKGTKKELVMNLTEERFDSSYVMVDGLGVGDVSSIVLRDRMHMSEDGMFVIIVTVDTKNRAIIGSPDLISRGFVYMKENRGLLNKVRHRTKKLFTSLQQDTSADVLEIKKRLRDEVGQLLYHETRRRPLILPVIIEV